MSNKSDAAEARKPDVFLTTSEKLLKWVEKNFKALAAVLLLVLVVGIGWLVQAQLQLRTERKAAQAIYNAEQALNQKRQAFAKAEDERITALKEQKKDKGDLKPAQIDFDKDLADLARAVETEILAHRGTNAAAVAAIELSGLYLIHKKGELAQNLLTQVKARSDVISALVDAQKATLALEQGEYDKALASFEQIVQEKQVSFMHPVALLKMGLCYEKLNQIERAKETYLRVSTEFADSESGKTAKGYLRLLELAQPQVENKEGS